MKPDPKLKIELPHLSDTEAFEELSKTNLVPRPTDPLATKIPKRKWKIPEGLALKLSDTSVVRHFARLYVNKAGGDSALTLEWLRPGYEPEDYDNYSRNVMRHEKVQQAIEEEYKSIGIDEKAKARYIASLWKIANEGNQKMVQTVLPLLGRALGIGEMADDSRIPTELPIKNLDKGWEQMTGKEATAAQNPTGFGEVEGDDMPELEE